MYYCVNWKYSIYHALSEQAAIMMNQWCLISYGMMMIMINHFCNDRSWTSIVHWKHKHFSAQLWQSSVFTYIFNNTQSRLINRPTDCAAIFISHSSLMGWGQKGILFFHHLINQICKEPDDTWWLCTYAAAYTVHVWLIFVRLHHSLVWSYLRVLLVFSKFVQIHFCTQRLYVAVAQQF